MKDKSRRNVPIWLSQITGDEGCPDEDEASCWPRPKQYRYARDDRIWACSG